jgi:hypothetical protein
MFDVLSSKQTNISHPSISPGNAIYDASNSGKMQDSCLAASFFLFLFCLTGMASVFYYLDCQQRISPLSIIASF